MTASLDLPKIRARFPALERVGDDGRPLVHADAPGGTQVVGTVLDAMASYLESTNANGHGVFPASVATDRLCAAARLQAAAFTGGNPDGIVFGPNMTTLTWHFARAFADRLSPGDVIVCTQLDHDANVAPWLHIADRSGAEVRWVRLGEAGALRLDDLERAVTDRARLVAFPRASNALGTIVDPSPFVAAAEAAGALTFMDAVHAAPHVPLRQQAHGVDVVVCSSYKFFGPHGGVLSAAPALLEALRPDQVRPAPDRGPERWQTGTASFEAIAGIGAALEYLDEVGFDAIGAHETALASRFLAGLADLPHVRLHGPSGSEGRTPTFCVTVDGRQPDDVAGHMAARGIAVWSGHFYALEPLRALGLLQPGPGAVRVGFVHYHGPDDVDRVLAALDELRAA
jgi:cysteine desulfurase family protein (TIGR01976 family)